METTQRGSASVAAFEGSRIPALPWSLVGLALAMLSASLGSSIVNVALPHLATTFTASFPAVQWLVIAYLLASTAAVVAVGRLGDVLGARRLLLGGLALFAIASLAAGLAPTLPWLLAARVVQGLGAAVLMASSVALARAVVAKERTGSAMGLLGTMSALGTALGPTLGGALVTAVGWRAVFFATTPLAVAALGLGALHLPRALDRVDERPARFDRAGTVVLAATLIAFALTATVRGPLASRIVLALAAVVGAAAFVAIERRAKSPLVPPSLLREPGLAGALGANVVVSAVMMGTLVVGPFHLVHALGLEPGQAGLVMSIGPAVSAVVGVPAGRLVDRLGAARVATSGLLGVAAGTAAFAALASWTTVPAYVVPLAVTTASYALFSAANNTTVMADASAGRRGVLSGLLSLSRNLGLMTGATLLGSVFAAACGADDVGDASRRAVATATGITFGLASLVVMLVLGVPMLRGRRRER